MLKFQYIRPDAFLEDVYPVLKGTCITIGTDIVDNGEYSIINWSVAFKNPKDVFKKSVAREVINTQFSEALTSTIIFDRGSYTRHEIVKRILMSLYINDVSLSKNYKLFVEYLVQFFYAGSDKKI